MEVGLILHLEKGLMVALSSELIEQLALKNTKGDRKTGRP